MSACVYTKIFLRGACIRCTLLINPFELVDNKGGMLMNMLFGLSLFGRVEEGSSAPGAKRGRIVQSGCSGDTGEAGLGCHVNRLAFQALRGLRGFWRLSPIAVAEVFAFC